MEQERDEYLSRKTGKLRKRRSDGWTRRDIDTFLNHLRITGNVSSSAAAVGKSARAADNLRAVDAAFDAQVVAARAEMAARMESKIALFAETGGKLPPLDENGMPMEPPLADFDPHLAMDWLKFLDARGRTRGRRGGPRPRSVSKDELVERFVKLIGMMKRRRAARAAA